MKSIEKINNYICFLIVAIVSFTITHAKDVTNAASLRPMSKIVATRSVDNGIHLDLHTHVHRQTASNLLRNAQADRPLTSSRELKKVVVRQERSTNKMPDGLLGQFIPFLKTS